MRAAKVQASLRIRPVWSDSSLCAQWVAKGPVFLHADSEDSDQTGRMPRLIWVFAGRTATLFVLSWGGSFILFITSASADVYKDHRWTASSEFGTYLLCEQRRFRRACASAQSRQNLRCSLIQAVSQEEPTDRKPDPWPLWMAVPAQLIFVMTECSQTQFRLTGLSVAITSISR